MRNRIEQWYDAMTKECSDKEIVAALQNGGIKAPEWMGMSDDVGHIRIWDNDSGANGSWGFMRLDYDSE